MTKLEEQVVKIKKTKKIGLMTHVVVGYPSLEETITHVKTMAENGADFVELQIPFSDPMADGLTIMNACEQSLKNGTTVHDAFTVMKKLSKTVSIPLLFMGYFNTVFHYGVEKFCKDARGAGASGLIFPDMPVDEENREHFILNCKNYDLHNIQVISPVSTNDRLRKNTKVANGFVYCTSRQDITGIKDMLPLHVSEYLKKVKKYFNVPIAVGFGISKKEHIQSLIGHADIVVIGSAIIEIIGQSEPCEREKNITQFLQSL